MAPPTEKPGPVRVVLLLKRVQFTRLTVPAPAKMAPPRASLVPAAVLLKRAQRRRGGVPSEEMAPPRADRAGEGTKPLKLVMLRWSSVSEPVAETAKQRTPSRPESPISTTPLPAGGPRMKTGVVMFSVSGQVKGV